MSFETRQASGKPSQQRAGLILAERVRGLYGSTPAIALGGLVLPAFIAALFWNLMRFPHSIVWVVMVGLSSGLWAIVLNRQFQRQNDLPRDAEKWLRRFVIRSGVAGTAWGLFIITDVSASDTSLIVGGASLIGYGAITVSTLSYYPPAHRIFSIALFTPFIAWSLNTGTTTGRVMAGLAAGGLLYSMLASRNLGRMIVNSLNTRFENLELIDQLNMQSQLMTQAHDEAVSARDEAQRLGLQADLARRDAVEANQAKSRFLAAASHDLRQPMHALGLFAAAVQPHVTTAEGLSILDKINASIASTETLFNALLDVSRLDAGILLPECKAFALRDLLARLVDEYSPRACAHGLALRLRPCDFAVTSDPALLERVLRNYLSNAIRYTSHGGILLAARARGDQINIEVWDTGAGIARHHLDEIFQEFYQIGNPQRNKANGLGLGLAIVRRIGLLLAHPVEVKSRLGRGSKFVVTVPRADILQATFGQGFAPLPDETVLVGAVVVVIDDEAVVLDAIEIILKQWGCLVVAARSLEAALLALKPLDNAPDAILSDYRLQGPETGIDAIKALQHLFGPVPAALISGDTAPDRLHEAIGSGFVLLHKPLNAAKLKTTLCGLLEDCRDGGCANQADDCAAHHLIQRLG